MTIRSWSFVLPFWLISLSWYSVLIWIYFFFFGSCFWAGTRLFYVSIYVSILCICASCVLVASPRRWPRRRRRCRRRRTTATTSGPAAATPAQVNLDSFSLKIGSFVSKKNLFIILLLLFDFLPLTTEVNVPVLRIRIYRIHMFLGLPDPDSNHEISEFFSTFVVRFCPPVSGSGFRIRIRIYWPDWILIQ